MCNGIQRQTGKEKMREKKSCLIPEYETTVAERTGYNLA
jgi:hypothetical protein